MNSFCNLYLGIYLFLRILHLIFWSYREILLNKLASLLEVDTNFAYSAMLLNLRISSKCGSLFFYLLPLVGDIYVIWRGKLFFTHIQQLLNLIEKLLCNVRLKNRFYEYENKM